MKIIIRQGVDKTGHFIIILLYFELIHLNRKIYNVYLLYKSELVQSEPIIQFSENYC